MNLKTEKFVIQITYTQTLRNRIDKQWQQMATKMFESSVSPIQELESLVSPDQNPIPHNWLFCKLPNFPIYLNCILTSN